MTEISIFDGQNRFENRKPLRLIELFAGYGSQHLALKYLGVPCESYAISEWAIKSIQAYKDMHEPDDDTDYGAEMTDDEIRAFLKGRISRDYSNPLTDAQIDKMKIDEARLIYNNMRATKNLGSVCAIKADEIPLTDEHTYLLTYSFPCITADSLILTEDEGYIPMSEIKPGMRVLTKGNTFERVLKKFDNGVQPTFYLNGMGFENIRCTAKHKFLVRTMTRKGHLQKRTFSDPEFKTAEEIKCGDYFGVPIIREEKLFLSDDADFWYLAGAYIGDGWLRGGDTNAFYLAGNAKKIAKWIKAADRCELAHSVYDEGACLRMRIKSTVIHAYFHQLFGTGSATKRIPSSVLCLPKPLLQAFYNGYLESDGCIINGNHQFVSVNRQIIYSVSAIVNKLYERPTRIYAVKTKPKGCICGRIVNQKPNYMLRFNPAPKKQDHAFVEGDYIWYPFKSFVQTDDQNVYNMEIENDHSYVVQGCISKNCQDLSLAGLRKGMDEDSGTRSGLLWEVNRLLHEWDGLGKLPDVLLMENVPEVVGAKNRSAWEKWIANLDSLGYRSYWKILNATDYGIPQNRRRCFMISIRGDYYFDFPFPIGLPIRLKHVLEPVEMVDESYYLRDELVESLVLRTKRNAEKGNGFGFSPVNRDDAEKSKTILTKEGTRMPDNYIDEAPICYKVGDLTAGGYERMFEESRRVYSPDGACPTLHTACGDDMKAIKILAEVDPKLQIVGDLKGGGVC